MLLSVCMIVRDEARNLPRCLASVAGVADEVVVVDTGSMDGTVEVATRSGAEVARVAWTEDFSAARNESLARARGRWILVLDADEALSEAARAGMRVAVERAEVDALRLIVRNHLPPGEISAYDDVRIVRLFTNRAEHRYEGAIHEQITPSVVRAGGVVGSADLVLDHFGYADPLVQGGEPRRDRNRRLLERSIAARPDDAYLRYQLGATYKALGLAAEAHSALKRALTLGGLGAEADAAARFKLAQLALARSSPAEAVEHATASLRLAPANPAAWQVLALAQLERGLVPEARAALVVLSGMSGLDAGTRADVEALLAAIAAT